MMLSYLNVHPWLANTEDKARGMSADTSAYNSIFDRLADPHYFTGIHKHVNDEVRPISTRTHTHHSFSLLID